MSRFLEINENGIYMTFEITDDSRLLLLNMSDKAKEITETEYNDLAYRTIEIAVTGRDKADHHGAKHTGGIPLKYVSHDDTTNEYGRLLSFKLSDGTLDVCMNYQFYNGASVVRTYAEVKNISDEYIGLEYISSFSLAEFAKGSEIREDASIYIPYNGWCREFNWHKYTLEDLGINHNQPFSINRIMKSGSGTWSSKEHLPMGCLINEKEKSSLMWQIESNTGWNWEIGDLKDVLYLRLSGPSEQENHWWKNLAPNQSFRTVNCAVAIGNGDFDSAIGELTKYRRVITRKNRADKKLPVIFNDYLNCLMADPTAEKLFPVIDKAAQTGAEYYCMDAGWYDDGAWWDNVGEWLPCESRFPNGIEEVAEYVRSKGMVFGMWIEVEVMGVKCPLADKLPDDFFYMRHGKRVIDHGRYLLDFRNEEVRKYTESVMDRLITTYKLGYMKLDYNVDPGIGTELDADSFGDGLMQAEAAFVDWIRGIMDKYPDLIIEACASGGNKIDYQTMENFSILSVSDQESDLEIPPIASAACTAVLPEQAAIWATPGLDMSDDRICHDMISAMLTRMHLSGKTPWLNDEQFELVKKGVAVYKEIRDKIPTSIPFYPLGVEYSGKKQICAGYKNGNEAYLTIWNRDDKGAEVKLPIEYKNAEIVFSSPDVSVSANGSEVTVNFPRKHMAAIVHVF